MDCQCNDYCTIYNIKCEEYKGSTSNRGRISKRCDEHKSDQHGPLFYEDTTIPEKSSSCPAHEWNVKDGWCISYNGNEWTNNTDKTTNHAPGGVIEAKRLRAIATHLYELGKKWGASMDEPSYPIVGDKIGGAGINDYFSTYKTEIDKISAQATGDRDRINTIVAAIDERENYTSMYNTDHDVPNRPIFDADFKTFEKAIDDMSLETTACMCHEDCSCNWVCMRNQVTTCSCYEYNCGNHCGRHCKPVASTASINYNQRTAST